MQAAPCSGPQTSALRRAEEEGALICSGPWGYRGMVLGGQGGHFRRGMYSDREAVPGAPPSPAQFP